MAVQIILKNSSVEDKRPNASQLTNGEISLNYNEAGAFLCCTDSSGEVQQVGGVKIDDDAPDAPVKQTLWFKPSTLTLSVYDGDKWLPIAGGGGGGTPGGGDIIQIIGNDGIDADTVAGIVTLDVELAGGDDGLEFKSSKLSATLASATDLGSVKVGDNINVTAGKISVPKATTSTFGVVKLGDGITIEGDGSISIDVPTTTVYRGSCDLNNPPTGQINPDPALKGDAYINSADAPAVDAGWTGITGSAKIGDLVIFDGAIWDLIPLGSGEPPVTSVNGKTGDVVLDYTDVGAASEAQGELADTALQPGDNISELNNDEGYITAAEAPVQSVNGKTGVVVLDAADVGALAPGDNVSLLANDAEYISKGDPVSDLDNDAEYLSKGDDISELNNDVPYLVASDLPPFPDQEPPVIISDTPPTGTDAAEGNLWFNSNDGRTYVYYKDGDSSQWVDASPDSGGAGGGGGGDSLWLEAGGYLSPKTGTNGVDIGGSKILLNVDGKATFRGDVTFGSPDITSASANKGFFVNDDGRITVQLDPVQFPSGSATAYAVYNGATATYILQQNGKTRVGPFGPNASEGENISLNPDGTGYFGGGKTKITGGPSTSSFIGNTTYNAFSINPLAGQTFTTVNYKVSSNPQPVDIAFRVAGWNDDLTMAYANYCINHDGTVSIGPQVSPGAPDQTGTKIFLQPDGNASFGGPETGVVTGLDGPPVQIYGQYGQVIARALAEDVASFVAQSPTGTTGVDKPAFVNYDPTGVITGQWNKDGAIKLFDTSRVERVVLNTDGTARLGKSNTCKLVVGQDGTISQPAPFSQGLFGSGFITLAKPNENDLQGDGFLTGFVGPKATVSIRTNGNIKTTGSVNFLLEADDDTKYTSTTDVDGNETLVYNGAVLDVKDRLQKADAALLALKEAAVAATDFASLQAAIVTALADI